MIKFNLATTDFTAFTAVELRKIGAQLGIKGAAKGRKSDILAAIEPLQAEAKAKAEKEAKEAAKAAKKASKPAKAEKAPRTRKQSLTDEEWAMEENGHSDQGHDAIAATPAGEYPANWELPAGRDLAKELAWIEETREAMERCPICHPERFAKRPGYAATGRYAVSRAGMKMNVTRKMTAKEKAELVAKLLTDVKITAHRTGDVTLTGTAPNGAEVELVFTQRSFNYKASTVGGKKVLNVAAALRAIQA